MTDEAAIVRDEAGLQAIIGRTPPAVQLKVIDHLDEMALRWIAHAPLAFAGFGGSAIATALAGGARGFCAGDRTSLRLPLAALDDPDLAQTGASFGALFLVPGLGETLRVNGRVVARDAEAAVIAVEECYGHCAKALIRSDFWSADPVDTLLEDPAAFMASCRFMALATMDGEGRADLSPKGDPAGSMARLDGAVLWFADRPGNRRVDSFRNILARPQVSAVLLNPGSSQICGVRGTALIMTDEAERARFAVRDKTPLLAVRLAIETLDLRESSALRRAQLWPADEAPESIDPAKMFVAHVKLNRDKGLGARMTGAVLSVPGLLRGGLAMDYKSNLY